MAMRDKEVVGFSGAATFRRIAREVPERFWLFSRGGNIHGTGKFQTLMVVFRVGMFINPRNWKSPNPLSGILGWDVGKSPPRDPLNTVFLSMLLYSP
jgi:hypothetical protein